MNATLSNSELNTHTAGSWLSWHTTLQLVLLTKKIVPWFHISTQ